MLVYDVTNRHSFENIGQWISNIQEVIYVLNFMNYA